MSTCCQYTIAVAAPRSLICLLDRFKSCLTRRVRRWVTLKLADCADWRSHLHGAPKNTPIEIIDTLNKEINAGLADPKMKAHLADLGSTPLAGSPGDFGKLIADEINKWAKVIQFANIKAE
jgi:hypothetical protein